MVERPSSAQHDAYQRIHASDDFAELKRRYLVFVVPVTITFLAWYLLFVVMSNWATGFMDTKVVGNVNVALVFGLLQFLSTFVIAIVYYRYSGKRLDPIADGLRADYDQVAGR